MMQPAAPALAGATRILRRTLAVLIALCVTAGASLADERSHRRGPERERHDAWRGDMHRFGEHDLGRWRAGRWQHGVHAGRSGWWWTVGSLWYYYPARVYPYPDPYRPPMVVVRPAQPATQFWYFCGDPRGYYPYVARCASPWQRVPASAPPGMPR